MTGRARAYWVIPTAAIVGVITSAFWYSPLLFGPDWMSARGISGAPTTPEIGQLALEFLRVGIMASVLYFFTDRLDYKGWLGAIQLTVIVWVGFQAVLLAGSVLHENYPWRLYLIHAGDAFAKTLAMSTLLCLFNRASAGPLMIRS